MKKKLFWYSLNPKQRLRRFRNLRWLMFLAIILIYVKLEFKVALGISLVLIIISCLEYKHLKREAEKFDKE